MTYQFTMGSVPTYEHQLDTEEGNPTDITCNRRL